MFCLEIHKTLALFLKFNHIFRKCHNVNGFVSFFLIQGIWHMFSGAGWNLAFVFEKCLELCLSCSIVCGGAKLLQLCPTLQSHGLQPARLLCPWDSPCKNTEVGCHAPSRGSSPPRDGTCIFYLSCIGRHVLYHLWNLSPLFYYFS